jgi:hypothetical protein
MRVPPRGTDNSAALISQLQEPLRKNSEFAPIRDVSTGISIAHFPRAAWDNDHVAEEG